MTGSLNRRMAVAVAVALLAMALCATAAGRAQALGVTWMRGDRAPGTPARYDRVGVIKVGRSGARNVLVLEPGTSAGAAYFVPLARWITARVPGWQVWAVERRENLLEDQSMLDRAKAGRATATALFDYYLGWIKHPAIAPRVHLVPDASVAFARAWGMTVAVNDLHAVIAAARRLGGRVVLGGQLPGGQRRHRLCHLELRGSCRRR